MRASYLWAVLILAAIGGWLASGDVIISGSGGGDPAAAQAAQQDTETEAPAASAEAEPAAEEDVFAVRVRVSRAAERQEVLTLRGRTEAKQKVSVRAQTAGLVEEIPVSKGDQVSQGDLLCRIEAGAREAQVLRAEAALAQAQQEYEASKRLNEQGHAAENRLRASKATLDAAKATLTEAQLDLQRTQIRAPFDGVIEALPAETGALLSVGEPCAELMAYDPMLAIGDVPERNVGQLERGMTGTVRLVTGQQAQGEITYIAPSSDTSTRTFRIEMRIDNPDAALRDGITSTLVIPLETAEAHFFSPAILTLSEKGEVGVRVVDQDNVVGFLPVEIVSDEPKGVWVTGLPEKVTLIVTGQEYVQEGEKVKPVVETAEAQR